VFYLLAAVLLVQAATGVCGFYNFLKWNTCENIKRKDKNLLPIALMVMIVVAVAGSYGSAVLTKDIFLNDLSSIREPYDLTIQYTSQDLRQESAQQFERLESSFAAFQEKYTDYRPLAVKFDDQFTGDMQNLSAISPAQDEIRQEPETAHDNLLRAEPSGVLARNGPPSQMKSLITEAGKNRHSLLRVTDQDCQPPPDYNYDVMALLMANSK
jgi:hypothetical protein